MIMFCRACGVRNEEAARFCVQCGARIEGDVVAPKPRGPRARKLVLAFSIMGAGFLVAVIVGLYWFFGGETVQDYSPVGPKGLTWEYEVKERRKGRVWTGTQRRTLLGEQDFEGKKAIVHEIREVLRIPFGEEEDRTVRIYFVSSRDSERVVGLEERGIRLKYMPGSIRLKHPVRVGTEWESTWERIVARGEARLSSDTDSDHRVVIAKEMVSVPAGAFEALKIEVRKSKNDTSLYTEWRARGVGIVKTLSQTREIELKEVRFPK